MRNILAIILKVVVPWLCSFGMLWWAYSMAARSNEGYYTRSEAVRLTAEMALVTTVLVCIVWLASPFFHREQTWLRLAVKTAVESAGILVLYTTVVMVWRNSWKPEKGLTDSAQFGPVVGHLNAQFLSDFGWLQYIVIIVPPVALMAGVLVPSLDFLCSRRQLRVKDRSLTTP